jgi:HPr kinase/phosphorylase
MTANIHATCIRIGNAAKPFGAPARAGVLILGESGAGKSDLALRLIGRGAELVADDRTELAVSRGRLVARAPKRIAGLLEVRGIGIVRLPHAASVAIALVVELTMTVPRMPERRFYQPPKKLALPQDAWPPLVPIDGREAAAVDKILIAAMGFSRRRLLE